MLAQETLEIETRWVEQIMKESDGKTDEQVHELLLTAFRQPAVDALLKTMIQSAGRGNVGDWTR